MNMGRFFKRFLASFVLLALAGQGCTTIPSGDAQRAAQPATINVWGVVDDIDAYTQVFADYRVAHPNVTFIYKRFRLEEYEDELLNALAEDRGPDIFMIHNTWTGEYMSKINPMPRQTRTAHRVLSSGLKKELTWELQTEPTISLNEFKNQFADVVQNDILRTINVSTDPDTKDFQQRPMGVPVGIDTLALYYNKDILNAAGIPTPPENWTQFADQVKRITRIDTAGDLQQTAAGIGTAVNVDRATDILTILMIQNGQVMADDAGYPQFNRIPAALSGVRESPPSYQALEFYTDFANPNKETYTWNENQPNSLDAFVQGRTAFFFGYAYHYDTIRARAPKLNMAITQLPQIEGNPTRNFANYWYFVVAKKSKHQDLSWNFLNTLTQPEAAKKVITAARRPAARKSLLGDQLNDERVGVFASQVLTATSWYRGVNATAMERALSDMISDVITGTRALNQAVRFANDTIAQTIQ